MIEHVLIRDAQDNLVGFNERLKHIERLETAAGVGTVDLTQPGYDAAGRLRVSTLTTLGDYKLLYADNPLLYDQVVNGTGTGTYTAAVAGVVMETSSSGDYVIRQSKQWHNYQSGKSHLAEWTFQDLTPEDNIDKRCGYYSTDTAAPYNAGYDGIYLKSANGTVNLIVDNDDTNTYTSPAITGIDWSKFTIVFVDFLWLGGSAVRLWLIQDGKIVLKENYNHAGNAAGLMMLSPNQPIRWEIRQTGTGSGSMTDVCAQVSSEGATNQLGISTTINTGVTVINATTAGIIHAVKGFRLQAGRRGISTTIKSLSLNNTSGNKDFKASLILNPTVANTFTYTDVANSSIQEATGIGGGAGTRNSITGGFEFFTIYGSTEIPIDKSVFTAIRAGSFIDGTMDEIVLAVQGVQNNQTILGAINLLEFV